MPPRFLSRINAQSQVLQDVFGNAGHQANNNSSAPPSVLTVSPPPTAHGPEPLQRSPETSTTAEFPGSPGSLSATPRRHRSRSRRRHGPSLSISSHTSIKDSMTTISTSSTPPLPSQEALPQTTTPPRRQRSINARPPLLPRQDSVASLPPPIPRQDSVTSLQPPLPTPKHKPIGLALQVPSRGHHRASSAPPSPLPGQTFAPLGPLHPPPKRGRGRERAGTRTSPPPRYSSRSRHRAASHAESLVTKVNLPPDSLILVTSAHTVLGQNLVGTLLNAGFRVRGVVPDAERAVRGFRLHREIFGPGKYTASVVDKIREVGALRMAVRSCRGVVVIDEKLPDMDYVMNVLEAARGEPDRSVERFIYCGAEGPAVLSVARDSDGRNPPPYGGEHEEVVKWKPPPLPQMPKIDL